MLYSEVLAKQVAEFLLEIKAVILRPAEPFTWASGWRSPIYCDNRLILSVPDIRTRIIDAWAHMVKDLYPEANAVAGVATAGIAHAALIADRLNWPMAYIRSKPKDHGTGKLIEGYLGPEHHVVVIEDLISTGKSSLQAAQGVKDEGIKVVGLMSVFSYGFAEADKAFTEAGISYYSLSDYDTMIGVALEKGYVKQDELGLLKEWRKNPSGWGQ